MQKPYSIILAKPRPFSLVSPGLPAGGLLWIWRHRGPPFWKQRCGKLRARANSHLQRVRARTQGLCAVLGQRPRPPQAVGNNCCDILVQTLLLKQHIVLLSKTAGHFLGHILLLLTLSSSQHWCSCQRLNKSTSVPPARACFLSGANGRQVLLRRVYLQLQQRSQQHPARLASYVYNSVGSVYVAIVRWGKVSSQKPVWSLE